MIIYDLLHVNSWNSSYGLITNDSVIQKTCFNLFVYIPLVLVRPESKIIGKYEKETSGGHSSKKYKWCLERKSKSGMNFPKCYTFCSKRYSQPKSFELSCFRSILFFFAWNRSRFLLENLRQWCAYKSWVREGKTEGVSFCLKTKRKPIFSRWSRSREGGPTLQLLPLKAWSKLTRKRLSSR